MKFLWRFDSHHQKYFLSDRINYENVFFSISKEGVAKISEKLMFYLKSLSEESLSATDFINIRDSIVGSIFDISLLNFPEGNMYEICLEKNACDFPFELLFLSQKDDDLKIKMLSRAYEFSPATDNRRLFPEISFIKSKNPQPNIPFLYFEETTVDSWLSNGFYCSFQNDSEVSVQEVREILNERQIVHFAGHVCSFEEGKYLFQIDGKNNIWLSINDVDGLDNYPQLILMNCCGSADLSCGSWVEFFLSKGCRCFIGSICDMSDKFAKDFSEIFYRNIVYGYPVGEALFSAQKELFKKGYFEALSLRFFGDYRYKIRRFVKEIS